MKKRKKIKTALLNAACLLLLLPSASFALADFNIYGGSPFQGKRGGTNKQLKLFDDYAFGASAHLNFDFLVFLQAGIGGFYQTSTTTYRYNKKNYEYDTDSAGLDAYIQLEIPFVPISPYIRGNEAAWSKTQVAGESRTSNFKRHGIGGGLLFTMLPVPGILKLQLFGEYMYSFGKEFGENFKEQQIDIGLRADLF